MAFKYIYMYKYIKARLSQHDIIKVRGEEFNI